MAAIASKPTALSSERKGLITSSVAAAALGLHPNMSQIEAWLRVRGEDEFAGSKATDRGTRLESLILDYPVDQLGLTREHAPFRRHPEFAWAGDSADAVYLRKRDVVFVGEAKSVAFGGAENYGPEGTDEVPDHVLVQCQWHLAHWPEAQRCVVPILIGGYEFEFRLYYVNRDPELIGIMFEDLAKWHRDYVVSGKPPAPMANDTEWLKQRYPTGKGTMLPDSPEVAVAAREYERAREAAKQADQIKGEASNRLRSLLGAHDGVKGEWGSVSYRNNKSFLVTDWESLCRDLNPPNHLIQKHTTAKPGPRVLRVTVR